MAYNAASHNPSGFPTLSSTCPTGANFISAAGERTGPVSEPPPNVPTDIASDIIQSAQKDPLRQHIGEPKMKTEKELEKERKKAEKLKKFSEKHAKQNQAPTKVASRTKDKKAKEEAKIPEYVDETKPGEKKKLGDIEDAHHKAYHPKVVESGWYAWWEKQGFFKPQFTSDGKIKEEGYFSIAIPPPNITGTLHMGHALTNALQDTMIRWNRMHGKTTLWLPGCDHAGIATQTVVENILWRREQKTRHDIGREKLTERIWKWKGEYHDKINSSHRKQGASLDWTREAYTMDKNLSAAVTETFVKLHEEGLIYRANRLVNWCVKLQTSISNLEVDNIDLDGRKLLDVPGYERKVEFGVIHHFKYPIDGSEETIEVATTRLETILGDTGIAVNPKDERYKHLVGKNAKHPFLDRLLPIFADEYVDMEFGTGAVKITPAHDPNDFELGKRHKLEFINIMNDDGTFNHTTGEFQGMKRFDARYEVNKQLKAKNLYVKSEDNKMTVPICNRSKDIVEPILKPQWWMKMKGLADAALKVVKNKEIIIRPDFARDDYIRWMENVQDWCLSRQLWWGHQAPAYFINIEGEPSDDANGDRWVTGRTEADAEEKAKAKFPGKAFTLTRDPDVLDTWFSSGLWPFSTLGWPNKTPDFDRLFPTSILETGWDILFFWVARMIMLSLKLTGKVPFKEVYCHSLIRDSEGRKMSKSLGNVIDPLDIINGIPLQALHDKLKLGNLDPKEIDRATAFQKKTFPNGIPECGVDGLRFALLNYSSGGKSINCDVTVLYAYRRFCNKIYQATKFVLKSLPEGYNPPATITLTGKESRGERWILHKFNNTTRELNHALKERKFHSATTTAYQYFTGQLCDVYIEYAKVLLLDCPPHIDKDSVITTLYNALEGGLRLLHPIMPFITEELWQRLPRRGHATNNDSIMNAAYPVYNPSLDNLEAEEAFDAIPTVLSAIRSYKQVSGEKSISGVSVVIPAGKPYDTCTEEVELIQSLLGTPVLKIETRAGPALKDGSNHLTDPSLVEVSALK